jgi:transposase
MAGSQQSTCSGCEALSHQVERLKAELAELRGELAKARKNSANSSKPPSSDITKPPKNSDATQGKAKKRKRGAQPGHPRHERKPFDQAEIDHFWDYTLHGCPDCHGPVELSDEPPRIIQQVELVAAPIAISEHRGLACWCPTCQKTHYAPLPDDIRRAGLAGPRLTALVAYLKGGCHCSFSTIRKFLRDVVGVKISRGQLRKLCGKVSDSLQASYEELLQMLPQQEVINTDETGHKNNGQRMWTWCFRTATFTLFKIDPSRSSQVLVDVLGTEFAGVLGCDYFSAYRKYMQLNENVLVQFCLAHLIRDIKFLVEHPEPRNRAYGRRVLKAAKELFRLIHQREQMAADQFASQLVEAGETLWAEATSRIPYTAEAENLATRFWKHGKSYIRFITTPNVEPTNNLAEQAIRFVVIDRLVTQGSRSEAGQRWLERIWTTMATCAQQGRSVFEFMHESILAHFRNQAPLSLVPNTS